MRNGDPLRSSVIQSNHQLFDQPATGCNTRMEEKGFRGMRCEVIAIGAGRLLAIIVDSNWAWSGEQLALAGIDSYFQVKVGDNFARIEACIRQGLERSDAVICCGGLGPTQDDITRDVIARVMGVEMRRDQAIANKIRHIFESRGRVMSANNLLQANIPIGAAPIAQMPGTAPGLGCPIRAQV